MFHKVESVKPLEDYKLEVIFQQVKVDEGGFGISWNDEIDLSCNELWENSEK